MTTLRPVPAALLLVALGGTAIAAPIETRANWSVSLLGLPLARAELTLSVDGDRYTAKLAWRTVGVVGFLAGAKGRIGAEGRFTDQRIDPAHYTLSGGSASRPSTVGIDLRDHRVVSAAVEPPSRPSRDLVPLADTHRIGIVDPLSAALLPGGTGSACSRTLSIFDGWSRYDVRLSAGSGKAAPVAGIDGPLETCAVRWVPIAGHRAEHANVRRLAAETDLSVTLARPPGLPFRLPVRAGAATPFGRAELVLEKITTGPSGAPPKQPPATAPGPDAGRKN